VPNISFGFPVIKAVKARTQKVMDVHLMIVEPDLYVEKFCQAGAQVLTVHVEACTHLHRTLQNIKSLGMKAGVALNPHTPISSVEEVATLADMFLIMSVNPGFGGQKFIENSLDKIRRLKQMLTEKGSNALIQVDGGVGAGNAAALFEAGADVLVAGNAVFSAEDPQKMIETLLKA
jgi:ribulose-phosphate 3-epimerase